MIEYLLPLYDISPLSFNVGNDIFTFEGWVKKIGEAINIEPRIIKIDDSTGVPHYSTRGDANNADDGYDLTFKDIVGVYTNKKIDKIGAVVLFLQSPIGISTFIAVLYSRIRIDLVSNSRDKVSDEYVSKLKKRVKFPDFEIKKVTFYLEDEKVTLDSQGNRERIKEEYSGPIREVYEECGKEQKILFDKEEKQNA